MAGLAALSQANRCYAFGLAPISFRPWSPCFRRARTQTTLDQNEGHEEDAREEAAEPGRTIHCVNHNVEATQADTVTGVAFRSHCLDVPIFVDMLILMPVATHSRTERAIELFHALSDETRLEIIELLRKGERCVCELTDTLDAAQSRLSFHLRVLRDAGIVRDRKDGRWVYYELDPNAFEEVETLVFAMKPRALPVRRADACRA